MAFDAVDGKRLFSTAFRSVRHGLFVAHGKSVPLAVEMNLSKRSTPVIVRSYLARIPRIWLLQIDDARRQGGDHFVVLQNI